MKILLALIATLVILPAYAAEYAQPAAAQPATNPSEASQPVVAQPASHAQPKTVGSVARAQFTSAIQDREPVDKVSNLLNDMTRVYFFSEIKDAADQKITHRWEHDGKVMSETSFDIGSNRWRVFSSKNLDPSWIGEWKVSVVDETGNTLGASTFIYEAAKNSAPSQPEAPAATPQKP
jgi:hypothetical protein